MPRRPGMCSRCGRPMALGKGSLPPGRGICLRCRREVGPPQMVSLVCANPSCGRQFERHRTSIANDHPCCSRSCSVKLVRSRSGPKTDRATRYKAQSRARRLRHAETWDGIGDDEILERDGWRCGICRKRIGKSFKYPHPRSASVDHVIPLSLGGDDTAVNKRASHLTCNVARGNKMAAEQLGLFGVIREPPLVTRTVEGFARVVKPRKPCECGNEKRPDRKRCDFCQRLRDDRRQRRSDALLEERERRRRLTIESAVRNARIRKLRSDGFVTRAIAEHVGTSHRMVIRALHADPVTGKLPR